MFSVFSVADVSFVFLTNNRPPGVLGAFRLCLTSSTLARLPQQYLMLYWAIACVRRCSVLRDRLEGNGGGETIRSNINNTRIRPAAAAEASAPMCVCLQDSQLVSRICIVVPRTKWTLPITTAEWRKFPRDWKSEWSWLFATFVRSELALGANIRVLRPDGRQAGCGLTHQAFNIFRENIARSTLGYVRSRRTASKQASVQFPQKFRRWCIHATPKAEVSNSKHIKAIIVMPLFLFAGF